MNKKIFSFLTLISFSLILFSCKKTKPVTGGGGTVSGDSIYVSLSRTVIEFNNFDFVTITVHDKNGNDITSGCSILLNSATAISNKYIPTSTGTFSIIARKSGCVSDSKTLTVVTKSPSPFTQKILLEDCTGAWCGYCPRLAYDISQYKLTHPNCISLAVHGGSSGTDPYKFQYYTTFNSTFGVTGYPTAVFNRKKQSDGTFEWSENTSDLDVALQGWAPLGLAINSSVSGSTVSGTVKIKFNVTTEKSMKVVIALVENGLVYPQTNYYSPQYGVTPYLYGGVSPINDFVHDGVLRRTATNLMGDPINVAQQTKDNILEVPFTMSLSGNVYGGATYNAVANNCAIVAFVVDGSTSYKGIYNVQYAPVGSTVNFD